MRFGSWRCRLCKSKAERTPKKEKSKTVQKRNANTSKKERREAKERKTLETADDILSTEDTLYLSLPPVASSRSRYAGTKPTPDSIHAMKC